MSLDDMIDKDLDVGPLQTINVCSTPIVSIANLRNSETASCAAHSLYLQNGNIFNDINMPSSPPTSICLVLHLLFEGFKS